MAYRDEIMQKIKNQYPYLYDQFGVKRIGLFGSVLKETDNKDSDVDLIVELDKPIGLEFISLVEYLESILNKKVDVITKDGLENIRLKKISSSIEKDISYV